MRSKFPRLFGFAFLTSGALIGAGCAPEMQESESKVLGALDPLNPEGTLGLAAAHTDTEPVFWRLERHSQDAALEGMGEGVEDGALGGAAPGLILLKICAMPCAIVAIPLALGGAAVGAVIGAPAGAAAGAASSETIVTESPLSDVTGAEALFEEGLQERLLAEHIRDRVQILMPEISGYTIRPMPIEQDITKQFLVSEKLGEILRVLVNSYGLTGEVGEDPYVALVIRAEARSYTVISQTLKKRTLGYWVYRGDAHRLSDWSRNDGALFREELDQAIQEIAQEIVLGIVVYDPEEQYERGLRLRTAKAERWFCVAANQGHAGAQFKMGELEEKKPIPDLTKAYMWYEIAASRGYPPAESNKEDIHALMSRAEISEAKRLAAERKPDVKSCSDIGSPDAQWVDEGIPERVQQSAERTSERLSPPEFRDEYDLTRKVVCSVPGEGSKTLIYSNCLYHNGQVLAETTLPLGSRSLSTEVQSARPMPKPEVTIGEKWIGLRNGKSYAIEVISIAGDTYTRLGSDGCRVTALAWSFAPSQTWTRCSPYADGRQRITSIAGELWPLEVGKRIRYHYTGSRPNRKAWSGVRNCEVKSRENVKFESGLEETFKIVCDDPSTRITYYVSPRLKAVVSWTRFRKRHNHTIRYELTRLQRPGEEAESALGEADPNAEPRRFIELERWIEQNENEFQHQVKGFRNAVKPTSHGSEFGSPHANY